MTPCWIFGSLSQFLGNLSNIYKFDILDVNQVFEEEWTSSSKICAVLAIVLILIINIPLLKNIFQETNLTFINKLIAADCILCISNCIILFNIVLGKARHPIICFISPPFGYFVNIIKRLLSIGIVLYRYVFVLRHSWVRTQDERRLFSICLGGTIFAVSVLSTCMCIFYRDQYLFYLGKIFICFLKI